MKTSKTHVSSGTFSILAISPDSKLLGVAVASGSTFVGDRVPHAKPGIGVIATQAYTNVTYGIKGLELMTEGLFPKDVLNRLLREDPEKETRQVAIMDFKKRKAIFTGADAPEHCAEAVGENHVVIGNLLSGKEVIRSMSEKFEGFGGDLTNRMAMALSAGSETGGDKRGEKSAALIEVSTERVELEINVGVHEDPIEELCRMLKSKSLKHHGKRFSV